MYVAIVAVLVVNCIWSDLVADVCHERYLSPKQAPRPQSGNSLDAAPVAAYIVHTPAAIQALGVTVRGISRMSGRLRVRGMYSVEQLPSYLRQVISYRQTDHDAS